MRHAKWAMGTLMATAMATTASSALAWKPTTHAYLAREALADALEDGRVTVYATDWQTNGFRRGPDGRAVAIGEYRVHPRILEALKAYPEKFFAGVIGPDGYPDIVTGQMRVHPPGTSSGAPDENANGPGTDAWLQKLWREAWTSNRLESIAWVTGYLFHAAGDMYAHNFINTHAGGIFNLTSDNWMKHLAIEGYIEQRTPRISPLRYDRRVFDAKSEVAARGVSGIEGFIAESTHDVEGFPSEGNKRVSIPYHLKSLRNSFAEQIASYETFRNQLQEDAGAATLLASPVGLARQMTWACAGSGNVTAECPDPRYTDRRQCPAALYPRGPEWCLAFTFGGIGIWHAAQVALAVALDSALVSVTSVGEPFMLLHRNRVTALDRALENWVKAGHGAAVALMFNPRGGADFDAALASYEPLKQDAFDIITGFPREVSRVLWEIMRVANLPLQAIEAVLEPIKRDIIDWAFRTSFGMSMADAKLRFTKPHVWVNSLFPQTLTPATTPREHFSVSIANQLMRVNAGTSTCSIQGFGAQLVRLDGACDIVNAQAADVDQLPRFSVSPPGTGDNIGGSREVFPAAYDTVTMTKLILMDPSEVNRLMADLGGPGARPLTLEPNSHAPNAPPNAMLGFAATIDGSHQWAARRNYDRFEGERRMIAARDCRRYSRLFLDARPDVNVRTNPMTRLPASQRLEPRLLEPRHDPGGQWEPSNESACSVDAAATPWSGTPPVPLTVTPAEVTVDAGASIELVANADATFTAQSGTIRQGADRRRVWYTAPRSKRSLDDLVTVRGAERTGHTVVHVREVLDAFARADANGRDVARYAGVGPGGKMTLDSTAAEPLTWSIVSGRGSMGDKAAEASALATIQSSKLRPPRPLSAISKQDTLQAQELRRKEDAAMRRDLGVAQLRLAEARNTYVAPAAITNIETVTLRGVAKDGRTKTVTLTLLPPRAPLALVKTPRTVKSGESFTFALENNLPVTWSFSGQRVGTMGQNAAEYAQLRTKIDAQLATLKPLADKIAHAKPEDAMAAHAEWTAAVFTRMNELKASFNRVRKLESMYLAPVVTKPTPVTIHGVAADGRDIDVTFTVMP